MSLTSCHCSTPQRLQFSLRTGLYHSARATVKRSLSKEQRAPHLPVAGRLLRGLGHRRRRTSALVRREGHHQDLTLLHHASFPMRPCSHAFLASRLGDLCSHSSVLRGERGDLRFEYACVLLQAAGISHALVQVSKNENPSHNHDEDPYSKVSPGFLVWLVHLICHHTRGWHGPQVTLKKEAPGEGLWCRRRESNPHERKAHCALNAARLPVPPLRRAWLFYPNCSFCQRSTLRTLDSADQAAISRSTSSNFKPITLLAESEPIVTP
jgi:hypothetical protein